MQCNGIVNIVKWTNQPHLLLIFFLNKLHQKLRKIDYKLPTALSILEDRSALRLMFLLRFLGFFLLYLIHEEGREQV